ncbi:MAG: nucleoside recognition domain-containing protein [Oscillospiraceae bacterium]
MSFLFVILLLLSATFGILTGNIDKVSNAVIGESTKAIEICFSLMGAMCLWSGVMRIAEKSGLANKISILLSPITKHIFKGASDKALNAISMNITANLLGLGNAATPLGIQAMINLKDGNYATNNMILFVVINTASMQLIPTTIATLRLKYNSHNPMEILPCVLICSAISLIIGVLFTLLINKITSKRDKNI